VLHQNLRRNGGGRGRHCGGSFHGLFNFIVAWGKTEAGDREQGTGPRFQSNDIALANAGPRLGGTLRPKEECSTEWSSLSVPQAGMRVNSSQKLSGVVRSVQSCYVVGISATLVGEHYPAPGNGGFIVLVWLI
jgi:hypothetical protein